MKSSLAQHQKHFFEQYSTISNDAKYRKAWKLLEAYPKGKLLGIGCANGVFSELLVKLGWQVWGVDAFEVPASGAKSKGLKVVLADVSRGLPFQSAFFDAVFGGEIIEHQIDPDFRTFNLN
ncbi:hypothetical protein HKBW3S25_00494 [Candidatus Hakubella thermalkaliphila]|uniref:Methyltransferase type 11 domain-containing protein n=1 Tax=Candidatus Hakubella thermalkaliphila TaxID=2754717 RepID=A0A6V8P050_9ACTN|nr:Ubiquinone biosynthesis O-methyltransferase [Bacillota bacterium]GFP25044.1 hypothetical protein HKBW3S25_00494 [Candidatus Hakubella thermalkaliphila]GFP43066.1 hypothetical protein HKBW3C_02198 [Candidatus Hakubella thermalkaliphila]